MVAVLHKQSEAMEPRKVSLTLTTANSEDVLAKISRLHWCRLVLAIEERAEADVPQLYTITKRCVLPPVASLSVSYHAGNTLSVNNAARLMTVANLLKQLDWLQCTRVDFNPHINYLDGDMRLELLLELPVNMTQSGISEPEEDAACFKLLESSYPYLSGCL